MIKVIKTHLCSFGASSNKHGCTGYTVGCSGMEKKGLGMVGRGAKHSFHCNNKALIVCVSIVPVLHFNNTDTEFRP